MGRVGLAPCVAALVALCPVSETAASSLESTSLESLAGDSDIVVVGRVVDTTALPNGPHGESGIHTRVTLRADDSVPESGRDTVSFWVHGGRLGNRLRRVVGQARFEPGEEVAVFLRGSAGGALWPTQMARGKWWRFSAGGARYVAPSVTLRGEPAPLPRPGDMLVAAPMRSPRMPRTALLERYFLARVRAARRLR